MATTLTWGRSSLEAATSPPASGSELPWRGLSFATLSWSSWMNPQHRSTRRAEAALFAAVRELFAGRSVILISHRFATVRLADHIYVLEAGRLIEHGDHDELMARNGLYAELFTMQASAFGLYETS